MLENETPLESWKEIAAYLQRNVVTVRRWEQNEGLPVHRHTHRTRASVYAYASEVDAWRESRKTLPEPAPPPPLWKTLLGHPRSWAFGATMVLCLISIGNGIRPRPASAEGFSLRQIDLPSVDDPVVSPNGRQIVQTGWDDPGAGSLAVYDQKGKKTILQAGHCGRNDSVCTFAELPALSPDFKSIAYSWYDDNVNNGHGQLRIVANTPGATPKTLISRADISSIWPLGWTPDGRRILAVLKENDRTTYQCGFVSVDTGELRSIRTFHIKEQEQFGEPRLSPDGRFIAYSAPVESRPGVRHIFILRSDGSAEVELTRDEAASDSPLWTPDGRALLYTSNQSGRVDLMALPVQDGRAAGPVSVIKRDIGTVALTQITADGSLYYTETSREKSIVLADASSNAALAQVRDRFTGISPRWSPDGKMLAFNRGDSNDLLVRTMESGAERKYPSPGKVGGPPMWFPDGKSLLQLVIDSNDNASYYRVDLATGAVTKLRAVGRNERNAGHLTADGKTLYVAGQDGQNPVPQVFALNLADDTRKTVAALEGAVAGGFILGLSPDHQLMGFVRDDGKTKERVYGFFTLPDWKYRELYRITRSEAGNRMQLNWRPDGKALLFGKPGPPSVGKQPETMTIMQIPLGGGAPTPTTWRVRSEGLVNLFPNPTVPNQLALTGDNGNREFWVLQNVIPAIAKTYAAK